MKINYSNFAVFAITLLCLLVILSSCADVTNIDACRIDKPAGFLNGLWHGLIAPVSFVASVFIDKIAMYEINNNGSWYDFGFVIGAGILFGGGSRATRR